VDIRDAGDPVELEGDVASQGEKRELALANLSEALALYFEDPRSAPLPEIHRVRVVLGAT